MPPKPKPTRKTKDQPSKEGRPAGGKSKQRQPSKFATTSHTQAAVEASGNDDSEGPTIVWDNDLSMALVAHIMEDRLVLQALYPPPGQNPSAIGGGATRKSDAHWMLAQKLFTGHDIYGMSFSEVDKKDKASRTPWAQKIKNRLSKMEKIVNEVKRELGSTGEGIKDAAEIDIHRENSFTNKWQEISQYAPWFFEMRNLIGSRPNKVRAGLGNSKNPIQMSVLQPNISGPSKEPSIGDDDELGLLVPQEVHSEQSSLSMGILEGANSDASDVAGEISTIPQKRPPPDDRPSSTSMSRKKGKQVDLSEVAIEEEKTRQQEIELAKLRIQQQMEENRLCQEFRNQRHEEKLRRISAAEQKSRERFELAKMFMQYGGSGFFGAAQNQNMTSPSSNMAGLSSGPSSNMAGPSSGPSFIGTLEPELSTPQSSASTSKFGSISALLIDDDQMGGSSASHDNTDYSSLYDYDQFNLSN